ncbi:MAG: hypothetical protein ICV62_06765 [Cyanobacteria bacterium Co-bin13]|nr:hypothetical protein [Cyanobacteria bacterium Co-bin13]
MQKTFWLGFCLSLAAWGAGQPGYALPGEPVRAVEEWIQANPTLRPGPGERLLINRIDTPAQRFGFQASIFPVSGVAPGVNSNLIRTERFSLFDLINGLDGNRMEESLRVIYGTEIYADYRRALPVYSYPSADAVPLENPNLRQQGEVRQGDRYAYWLELDSDQTGTTYSGRMAIFLKEDLPLLLEQLGRQATP